MSSLKLSPWKVVAVLAADGMGVGTSICLAQSEHTVPSPSLQPQEVFRSQASPHAVGQPLCVEARRQWLLGSLSHPQPEILSCFQTDPGCCWLMPWFLQIHPVMVPS